VDISHGAPVTAGEPTYFPVGASDAVIGDQGAFDAAVNAASDNELADTNNGSNQFESGLDLPENDPNLFPGQAPRLDLYAVHGDLVARVNVTRDQLTQLAAQADSQGRMVADLHAKVDHALEGLGHIYTMVQGLVNMLSAVQQVASMMPGGKRIAQAMAAQAQNGANQNG